MSCAGVPINARTSVSITASAGEPEMCFPKTTSRQVRPKRSSALTALVVHNSSMTETLFRHEACSRAMLRVVSTVSGVANNRTVSSGASIHKAMQRGVEPHACLVRTAWLAIFECCFKKKIYKARDVSDTTVKASDPSMFEFMNQNAQTHLLITAPHT